MTPKSVTNDRPVEGSDLMKQQELIVEREKQRYAKEHGAFRCASEAAPFVERHDYDQKHIKTLSLSRFLNLRLRVGKSVEIPGTYTYRTESEFILSTTDGEQLAAGESMMCLGNGRPSDGDIEVLFNPAENSVLIQEETFGAGSSVRHIAFIPKPGVSIRSGGKTFDWQVVHLDLPQRSHGIGDEGDHIGRVLGLTGRKVYVEMDGVYYAFPVEEVVTTELGISNG